MKSAYPVILAGLVSAFATPVLAHFGHVGEVAGHGHLIAIGAAIAAAALAGLVARGARKVEPQEPNSEEIESASNPDAEPETV